MGTFSILLVSVAIGIVSASDIQEFAAGNLKFSANVIRFESPDQHNKGVISTLSAQLALALLADGAKGETYDELKNGLSLPDKQKTNSAVKTFLSYVNKKSEHFELTFANKLFVDHKYKVKKEFEDTAKTVYESEIQTVNYTDNHGASEIINAWVINKTDDKFQNFMSPDRFDGNTALVIDNGIYINGKWETPFPKKNTNRQQFNFLRKDPGDVDMMHNTGKYLYFHCGFLQAKFLQLSLKDSTVEVVFVLPDAKDGIKNLEKNVEQYLEPHNVTLKEVDVSLPRITATTYHDFQEFLSKLNVSKVLSNDADLSGISDQKAHLKAAPQRASIDINEDGVDGATTTADIVELTRKGRAAVEPSGLTFTADHPFFYYLRETKSNVILFVARFQ